MFSNSSLLPTYPGLIVTIIFIKGEELRALGPDRMSIMVAAELVRHCKAHREVCTQRNIIEHSKTLSNTARYYRKNRQTLLKKHRKNSKLCTWRHIVVGHSSQKLLPKMLAESRLWGLLMATSRLKLAAMADNIIQQCSISLCGCDWYR